jgi:hypothetical protein
MHLEGGRFEPQTRIRRAQQIRNTSTTGTSVASSGDVLSPSSQAEPAITKILKIHSRADLTTAHPPQRLVDRLPLDIDPAGEHLRDDLATHHRFGARSGADPRNRAQHVVSKRAAALPAHSHIVRCQRDRRSLNQCYVVRIV